MIEEIDQLIITESIRKKIQEPESRIRNLEEKIKLINFIKSYW